MYLILKFILLYLNSYANTSNDNSMFLDFSCKAIDCYNSPSCLYIEGSFNESIDFSKIDVKKISHIFSHYHNISEIPDEIMIFKNLTNLSIISKEFCKLSNQVNKLHKLEQLHIDSFTIDKINGSIKNLVNLQKLTIRNDNQKFFYHKELPYGDYIPNMKYNVYEFDFKKGNFVNLKELFICIRYQTIKSIFCEKTNTFKRTAHFHTIKRLPDEICFLHNLKELNITSQEIKNLPENIGNLQNLKILNLNHNCISNLPESFSKLLNLEILSISNNYFSKIDDKISNLINLVDLDFSFNFNNKSEYFFEDNLCFNFSKLKKLKYLNLSGLKISRIHKSIVFINQNIKFIDLNLTALSDNDEGDFIGRDTLFYVFENRLLL
ncbi:leucine-rich repeat containing protein [Vairimorpha apis BRL 01]|uniref:Leucine-rich repeat containing protein n=1 Tax=Vairimorpha apis BRL 01 TaxID=1037528 RepID=T0L130_9MICR|nr:leucine-rich repeat containing protein [Vairimorpha apis BRL 01]